METKTISISPEGKLEERAIGAPPPKEAAPPTRVMRTFERDIASAMRENKGSVVTIAIAERRKREAEAAGAGMSTKQRTIVIVVLGILFLLLMVAGAYFYVSGSSKTPEQKADLPPSLIPADTSIAIPADGFSEPKLIEAAKRAETNTALRLGTIEQAHF